MIAVLERETKTLKAGRVDKANRRILGVKVLGVQSQNPGRVIGLQTDDPYSYSLEALRRALPLYEGTPVNIDHPEFRMERDGSRSVADGNRKASDRFGRLVNVRLVEAGNNPGLFADLEYLESHPMTERIIEAAEHQPAAFCLSHAASTLPRMVNGRPVIVAIESVESVDLISEKGGTTFSLFESQHSTPTRKGSAKMKSDYTRQLLSLGNTIPSGRTVPTFEQASGETPKVEGIQKRSKAVDAFKTAGNDLLSIVTTELRAASMGMGESTLDEQALNVIKSIEHVLSTVDALIPGSEQTQVNHEMANEENVMGDLLSEDRPAIESQCPFPPGDPWRKYWVPDTAPAVESLSKGRKPAVVDRPRSSFTQHSQFGSYQPPY